MKVDEGAREVEGDVGELTMGSNRAEEDRREGLDVGAEHGAEQQLQRLGVGQFRSGLGSAEPEEG